MSEGSDALRKASGIDAPPEVWGALKSDVNGLADVALQQGRQIVDTARDQAKSFADERKDDAAQAISDVAATLRDSGKALDQQPTLYGFVNGAADGLEQIADSIRTRTFGEIYTDIEEVIRARPILTATTTLFAGFLLARFIKSSGEQLAATERRLRQEAGQARAASRPRAES